MVVVWGVVHENHAKVSYSQRYKMNTKLTKKVHGARRIPVVNFIPTLQYKEINI